MWAELVFDLTIESLRRSLVRAAEFLVDAELTSGNVQRVGELIR